MLTLLPSFRALSQSLITAYLTPFRHTIQHLCALFSRPPSLPAPAFHPSCPRSLLAYLHRLLTLLRNLLAWNGYVSQNQNRVEQDAYALLVDKFVGEVLWRFVREARDVGGREVARTVSKVTPQRLLAPDVRSRFEALAA